MLGTTLAQKNCVYLTTEIRRQKHPTATAHRTRTTALGETPPPKPNSRAFQSRHAEEEEEGTHRSDRAGRRPRPPEASPPPRALRPTAKSPRHRARFGGETLAWSKQTERERERRSA
ncbi:hypothetical protein DAI22_10g159401 [Oryza sativa Japonica Group]|nr:hypothetical protein DAI22_10g159401 [Oryza sativa Japonica Group]